MGALSSSLMAAGPSGIQGAMGVEDPDLVLARSQMSREGAVAPALAARLKAKGIDPSMVTPIIDAPGVAPGPNMSPQGASPRPQPSSGTLTPAGPTQTGTGPDSSPAATSQMPEPSKEETAKMIDKAKNATPEMKKQINESGFDFDKAFKEWSERFGGLVDTKAKMTKQEKGLFLMDFGMRMMGAAGAGADAFEAAGTAGVPVLQGIRQRQGQAEARNAGVLGNAMKGVEAEGQMRRSQAETELSGQRLEVEKQRMEIEKQKAGRLGAKDIIWTQQGAMIVKPDGTTQMVTGPGGGALQAGATPGQGNKLSVAEWQFNTLVEVGDISPKDAIQIVNGAWTPMEVAQRGRDLAEKRLADLSKGERAIAPGDERKTAVSGWNKQQRDAWIDAEVARYRRGVQAIQQPPGGGGGALGGQQNDPYNLFTTPGTQATPGG